MRHNSEAWGRLVTTSWWNNPFQDYELRWAVYATVTSQVLFTNYKLCNLSLSQNNMCQVRLWNYICSQPWSQGTLRRKYPGFSWSRGLQTMCLRMGGAWVSMTHWNIAFRTPPLCCCPKSTTWPQITRVLSPQSSNILYLACEEMRTQKTCIVFGKLHNTGWHRWQGIYKVICMC